MIRRPPRSTQSRSSAASDVYKRQHQDRGMVLAEELQDALVVSNVYVLPGMKRRLVQLDEHSLCCCGRNRLFEIYRIWKTGVTDMSYDCYPVLVDSLDEGFRVLGNRRAAVPCGVVEPGNDDVELMQQLLGTLQGAPG